MRRNLKWEKYVSYNQRKAYSAVVDCLRHEVWNDRVFWVRVKLLISKYEHGWRTYFSEDRKDFEPITDTDHRTLVSAKKEVEEFLEDRYGENPKE